MIRLAQPLAQALATQLERGVEADVGDIGDFAGDLWGVPKAGEVTGGNAKHFALLEVAQFRKGAFIILGLQGGLEPGVDFPTQALLLAWKSQVLRVEDGVGPLGMLQEQQAHGLRSAEDRRENAGVVRVDRSQ